MRTNIAPAAEQAGLCAKADVVSQGVIPAGNDRVELLYFVDVFVYEASAKKTEEEQDAAVGSGAVGSCIKVTAERDGEAWLMSASDPI